jgi:hypothetical protein
MPDAATRGTQIDNPEIVLAHSQDRLKILIQGVKEWAERAGWRTRTIGKSINDRKIGKHTVPVLLMRDSVVGSTRIMTFASRRGGRAHCEDDSRRVGAVRR